MRLVTTSTADITAEDISLVRVGELAKRTGKTVRAIHLYEELGLLAPAVRSKGGFRLYSGKAVKRIDWIQKLQDLGFSLTEIKAFLRDWEESDTAPQAMSRVREIFSDKLRETRGDDRAPGAAGRRPQRDAGVHGQLPVVRAGAHAGASAAPAASTDTTDERRCWSKGFIEDERHGTQAPHLHGQPRDHAGRSARARGDAAVLHAGVRQRRQPHPQLRLDGREGGRDGARAGRRADRRHAARRSSGPRARPSRTTWRIKGAAEFYKDRGNHIITAQTEHKAVLDTCKRLEKDGFEVTYLPVGKDGRVSAGGGARGDDRQDHRSCRSCWPTTRSAPSTRSTRSARS